MSGAYKALHSQDALPSPPWWVRVVRKTLCHHQFPRSPAFAASPSSPHLLMDFLVDSGHCCLQVDLETMSYFQIVHLTISAIRVCLAVDVSFPKVVNKSSMHLAIEDILQ